MRHKKKKSLIFIAATAIGVAAMANYVLPFFNPASEINCLTVDLDLNSGKLKTTRKVCWIAVSTSYTETAISELIQQTEPADWQRIQTLTPGRPESISHPYSGAKCQARSLATLWKKHNFCEQSKTISAKALVDYWQASPDSSMAGSFLDKLYATPAHAINPKTIASIVVIE